jgi:hypothetical protein
MAEEFRNAVASIYQVHHDDAPDWISAQRLQKNDTKNK